MQSASRRTQGRVALPEAALDVLLPAARHMVHLPCRGGDTWPCHTVLTKHCTPRTQASSVRFSLNVQSGKAAHDLRTRQRRKRRSASQMPSGRGHQVQVHPMPSTGAPARPPRPPSRCPILRNQEPSSTTPPPTPGRCARKPGARRWQLTCHRWKRGESRGTPQ